MPHPHEMLFRISSSLIGGENFEHGFWTRHKLYLDDLTGRE
jgi:hypothetical protein